MHEDTGTAADNIEPTATKADAQADYGIGLSAATPTTPPADPRTDAEVIADMRQSSAFPTLLDAFPTTPEGPKRPTSSGERRAAKRAFKHDLKEARRNAKDAGREHRQATKAERQRYKSISRQLKERDRELSQGATSTVTTLVGLGAGHPRPSMNIDDKNGLAVLLPMLVSALICSMLVDVATIISMVVVWGRGMQLYFMATMSPIPLALLGIDETRQMGVGFLRNYAALVLGYAALGFVVKLFPTLLQMSIATSFVMGGDGEMILSITAACILEIILTVKCGGWARDVLGG